MINKEIVAALRENLGEQHILKITAPRSRRIFVFAKRNCFKEVILFLNSIGFTHLSTITGCQNSEGSIEILYHFENQGTLVTVRVSLPINVGSLSTITDIVPGSVLYEREIHDLFGIKFEGHPDLSRLILPDEWPNESYPLNKNTSSLTTQK